MIFLFDMMKKHRESGTRPWDPCACEERGRILLMD